MVVEEHFWMIKGLGARVRAWMDNEKGSTDSLNRVQREKQERGGPGFYMRAGPSFLFKAAGDLQPDSELPSAVAMTSFKPPLKV